MESHSSNFLISLIHNRDLQSLGAEPSLSLLGREDKAQRNLDYLSMVRFEG